jgi:hypothetical protein
VNADALMRSRYWRLHSSLPDIACGFSRGAHTVSVHLRLGDLIRPTMLAPQTSMTKVELSQERNRFSSRAAVSVHGFQRALQILANATSALGAPAHILVVSDSPFPQLAAAVESVLPLRLHRLRDYSDAAAWYVVARVDPLGLEIHLLQTSHPLLAAHCLASADTLRVVPSSEQEGHMSNFGRMASLLSRGRTVSLSSLPLRMNAEALRAALFTGSSHTDRSGQGHVLPT